MLRSLAAANSVPLSLPESAITRLASTLPIWSAFACLGVKTRRFKRFSGESLASRSPYCSPHLGLFIPRLRAFAHGAFWFWGFFKTFGV